MAPRANWKGYLKLSLVSCAVALYPASSTSSRVSFNTLNKKTGNKVKRIYVDPDTNEEVPTEDQVKGYPVSKRDFLVIDEEELDKVKIESSQTVDIEKFVPREEIDPRYMDTPYYIAPDDRVAQEPFAVIRDAMKNKGMVGIGRVVISRRERIMMLEPWGKGLLGTVLRYGYEVRDDAAYFGDIPEVKIPADMVDLAGVIIDRKGGHWDPAEFEDRYEEALTALIQSKQRGEKAPEPVVERPHNVVNLMQALRESIEREKSATGGAAKPAASKKTAAAEPEPKPLAPSKSRKAAGKPSVEEAKPKAAPRARKKA